MKKFFMASLMAIVVMFTFPSCDMLDTLMNYEEQLSLSSEEMDELIVGEWILVEAGRYLDRNEYDEDYVYNDPEDAVTTSIKSIKFIDSESPVIYFKDEVVFEVNDLLESGGWVVSTASYKEFAVDMDKHILKFGCGYEGKEYYILYNGTCGGIRNYMIRLFGVEKNNGYDVKRMILSAEEDTYYEFKPVK